MNNVRWMGGVDAAVGGYPDTRAERVQRSSRGWEKPIALADGALPAFPVDALPEPCRGYVSALAESTQTPPDLAALLALAALATLAGGRAEVELKPGWIEPLPLWILTVLPPASRKSAVLGAVISPLLAIEQEERHRARARSAGVDAKEAEPLVLPQLFASDITPERAAGVMHEQGGRLGILCAEGGVIGTLAGRYNRGQVILDTFLSGHSGDPLRIDRQHVHIAIDRPALTLGLASGAHREVALACPPWRPAIRDDPGRQTSLTCSSVPASSALT